MPILTVEIADIADDPERRSLTSAQLGADVVAIRAAHQAGELYPTFTLTFRPHRPDPNAPNALLTIALPPRVTIRAHYASGSRYTDSGMQWVCVAQDAQRALQGRSMTCDVTYLPQAAYVLRYRQYNKALLFVSAPAWQRAQLEPILQAKKHVAKFKESDPYTATGWTVNEVVAELSTILNASPTLTDHVTLVSDLPTLHLPSPTVTYTPDQTLLSFLRSLLPGNFTYIWDWQNAALHLRLAQPATQPLTIPPRAVAVEYAAPPMLQYDTVVISGGQYRRTQTIPLGDDGQFGSHSSEQTNQLVTETSEQTDSTGRRTVVTRQIRKTPEGTPFAVVREETDVYVGGALTQHIETDISYTQDNANIYEAPRFAMSETSTSGMITRYVAGAMLTADWILTEDGVMTGLQYGSMAVVERPTAYASAYREWSNGFERRVERKTYTAPNEVTADWPEGSERLYEVQVYRLMANLNTLWFDCMAEGRQALLQLPWRTVTTGQEMRQVESLSRAVKLQTKKQYVFEELRAFVTGDGNLQQMPVTMTRIESDPPSAPTRYRVETLKALAGEEPDETDQGALCYATTATIPTNNPQDFEAWAALLYFQMTQPQQAMTVTTKDYLIPVGYRLGGGTVIAWDVRQEGDTATVTLTIT